MSSLPCFIPVASDQVSLWESGPLDLSFVVPLPLSLALSLYVSVSLPLHFALAAGVSS